MSKVPYHRVKVDYKPEPLKIKVNLRNKSKQNKDAKAQIDFVLMSSNLTKAQREALKQAKDLLNG